MSLLALAKANLDYYESMGNLAIIGLVALFLFSPSLCEYLPDI